MSVLKILVRVAILGFGLMLVLAARAGATSGIDVSNYQHPNGAPINWSAVRGAGHKFVFVKATEGPSGNLGYYTNPHFEADWNAVAAHGMYRGAYHFARPQLPLDSAVLQARHFVSVTGSMHGLLDLPPVLDLESNGGLSRAEMVLWTQGWLNEVERLTGRRPIIYTGYYFWNDNVGSTNFGHYRLWMPRYTSAPDPYPLPNSWPTWTFWQYSSTGSVPGIVGNVDMNLYCCPESSLAALADGTTHNTAASNPFGGLDATGRTPNALQVHGWAIDPDTTGEINIHAYVDGQFRGVFPANGLRHDIGAAFPGWGSHHGYSATITVGPGPHQVCTYAINKGSGTGNTALGCATVASNPAGSLDGLASGATGEIEATGWAIDPDSADPATVHLYVDGKGAAVVTADQVRTDVGDAYPAFGPKHGFRVKLGGHSFGHHTVCAYAINIGSGNGNSTLGCQGVDVLAESPVGGITAGHGGPRKLRIDGWGFDPNHPDPISVHVYVDGKGAAVTTADGQRNFSTTIAGLEPGDHHVCAYGINRGTGSNATLGCTLVKVPSGNPWGAVDDVTTRLSMITVRGWSLDPDQDTSNLVHLYLDGRFVAQIAADAERGDLGAAFPLYGAHHGFQHTIGGVGGGRHVLCAYGINALVGANSTLGCRTVDLSGDPFGNFEAATRTGSSATISGWMLDPDVPGPASTGTVHVYVDGKPVMALDAKQPRGDVENDFPEYGKLHGFSGTLSNLTPGAHEVCVYGINSGPGTNALIGCLPV